MSPKETPQSLHPETLGLDLNSDLQLVLGGRAGSKPRTLGRFQIWSQVCGISPSLVGVSELNDSSKGLSPIHMEIAYI